MKSKKYYRALKVFEEVISLDPTDASSYLLAAKICLNYLNEKTNDALDYAKKAVELGGFHETRSYHILGLTYSKLAQEANSRTERKTYNEKALEALKSAFERDPNDYLICYHIALQYAEDREIRKAFTLVKKSISLNSRYEASWLLLTLLFTAEKDYTSAHKTIKVALTENPKSIKLLFTSARLLEVIATPTKAKKAYYRLLKALVSYKAGEPTKITASNQPQQADEVAKLESPESKLQKRAIKTAKMYLYVADAFRRISSEGRLDADDDENIQEGIARIQAAKEILGKIIIDNSHQHIDPGTILVVPTNGDGNQVDNSAGNIYADAFDSFVTDNHRTSLGSDSDFYKLLQKICADVRYMEGRYNEDTGNDSAVKKYENALVCNADHPYALVRIGIIMSQEQKLMLARSHLHNAVRVDPSSHEAWYHLGLVMKEMGDLSGASECFMASLKLEQTSPLIPFDKILKVYGV
jgi:tetratricopeptide (TPR) repeat protein